MRAANGILFGIALAIGTGPGYYAPLAEIFAAHLNAVETAALRYTVNTLRHVARLKTEGTCNEHCC